jgi:hypothetical protein
MGLPEVSVDIAKKVIENYSKYRNSAVDSVELNLRLNKLAVKNKWVYYLISYNKSNAINKCGVVSSSLIVFDTLEQKALECGKKLPIVWEDTYNYLRSKIDSEDRIKYYDTMFRNMKENNKVLFEYLREFISDKWYPGDMWYSASLVHESLFIQENFYTFISKINKSL